MIDAYLPKDTLSIILKEYRGDDKRFFFNHPEKIVNKDNYDKIADELYPNFIVTKNAQTLWWDRQVILDVIACSLFIYYVGSLHEAQLNYRTESMQ